jgi:hypothetical protein
MTGQDYMSLGRTEPSRARPGPEPAVPGGLAGSCCHEAGAYAALVRAQSCGGGRPDVMLGGASV